ncbi:MAG: hypothetical protein LUD47_07525 [Clostridia bacterium]|nr:hypothetical protein [Clostridia bacterium]
MAETKDEKDKTEYERTEWVDWETDEAGEIIHEGTPLDRPHFWHIESGVYEANRHVYVDDEGYLCVHIPKAVTYDETAAYTVPTLMVDGSPEGTDENGHSIPTLPTEEDGG